MIMMAHFRTGVRCFVGEGVKEEMGSAILFLEPILQRTLETSAHPARNTFIQFLGHESFLLNEQQERVTSVAGGSN